MKKAWLLVLPFIISSLVGCNNSSKGGYTFDDVSNENGSMSYEIFVRSFYDHDGDGIGDLLGVKDKLPYLYDLGIKTLWLMPIQKSPSYHGYDISNYYDINPDYGSLNDFDELVKAANEYHIDIMLDMVFNHCSNRNAYFTQSYEDFINHNSGDDSKADWFNWTTTTSDIGAYHQYKELYYESRFDASMPDFNLDCQGVRDEIENIMKFWIVDHGVKGFRLDAVLYYYYQNTYKNVDFLTWLENTAHKYDENFYIVGECWQDAETINRYYDSSLDSFFRFDNSIDGDYYSFIGFAKGIGSSGKLASIEENETAIKKKNPNAYSSYFLSNHDQDRISKSLNETQNKCAASMLCLMPGTPFMYYGEEIQMVGVKGTSQSDVKRRLPMIWSKSDKTGECDFPEKNKPYLDDTTQVKLGVNDQLKKGYSLLNHYKKAINIRNKYPFMKKGCFKSMMEDINSSTMGVIAYQIYLGNEYINIIHNFTNKETTVNAIGNEILDEINTSKIPPRLIGNKVTIAPYSSVIMK